MKTTDSSKLATALVRFSVRPRVIRFGERLPRSEYGTIASHDYLICYHAGTHYGRMDDGTDCHIDLKGSVVDICCQLQEHHLTTVLETLEASPEADFWETDAVSLNFIDISQHVVQVGVKADGRAQLFRDGSPMTAEGLVATISREEKMWNARIQLPLALLGLNEETVKTHPIPFDLVRFHQANGAITSWCPIPDQLPFHENYQFPVFCFGLLAFANVDWDSCVAAAPDIGTFHYAGPQTATAGEHIRFAVTYTAGKHGLQPGGMIRFVFHNEVIECNRRTPVFRRFPEKDWSPPQWDDPAAPGFVATTCANPRVRFRFANDTTFATTIHVDGDQGLAPGESVTVSVGEDPRGPGMRTQLLHQEKVPLKVFVDPLGNGVIHMPQQFPTIDILGGPAQSLQVHCQPTPDPGEIFRLVVVATDYHGNIAHAYGGTVAFFGGDLFDGLPGQATFTLADRGVKSFNLSIPQAGQYLLRAVDVDQGQIHGLSNPIVTDGSFGPGKIYFGDIHTHTQCSDGRLPLEQKFREVAYHRGCDFWGLTDHAYDLTTERIARIKTALGDVNEDGRFVTLPGYEWTCSDGHHKACARKQYGHRNVHFRDDMDSVADGISPLSNTPQKLVEALDKLGQDYVIFNHFHCGDPTSYPDVDEGFEVSSWCGNWTRDTRKDKANFPNASIADLFDHNFRGAVVAGSDHGTEAYYTGMPAELTAVHAERLTRHAVFDALKAGHTYATSGQKVLLAFTVAGTSPGRNHQDVTAPERVIRVTTASVMPIVALQIVKNGRNWQNLPVGPKMVQTIETVDHESDPEKGYYYVRIRTAEGHTTWSSPVFYELTKHQTKGSQ